jgi:hypothetical protein
MVVDGDEGGDPVRQRRTYAVDKGQQTLDGHLRGSSKAKKKCSYVSLSQHCRRRNVTTNETLLIRVVIQPKFIFVGAKSLAVPSFSDQMLSTHLFVVQ